MAFLTQLTRAQLRSIAVDAYNAGATIPAATDAGSSFGSTFDGLSLMAMELQRQIAYNVAIDRLSTIIPNADGSPNPDVDSYCAPFNVLRGGTQYASGSVTLSAPSPVTSNLIIPVGGIVTTQSGLQFAIVPDTNQSAFNAVDNGYVLATGQTSVTVTVKCLTGGTIGNVQAGQIQNLYGGPGAIVISGITTVSNPGAFTNGSAYESDAAYIARFALAVSTGRTATYSALGAAILALQTGLTYSIGDRLNADGSAHAAYFTAVVAELGQSGATSPSLLAAARTALEGNPAAGIPPVRGIGISYQVISPTILTVTPSATIAAAPGYTKSIVQSNAAAAYVSLVEAIGLDPQGNPTVLPYGQVYATLYGIPGVLRVDYLALNGAENADISAGFGVLLAPGTPAFTMA